MSELALNNLADFGAAVPATTARMQTAKAEGLAPVAQGLASILKMAGVPERLRNAITSTVEAVSASIEKVADHAQKLGTQFAQTAPHAVEAVVTPIKPVVSRLFAPFKPSGP